MTDHTVLLPHSSSRLHDMSEGSITSYGLLHYLQNSLLLTAYEQLQPWLVSCLGESNPKSAKFLGQKSSAVVDSKGSGLKTSAPVVTYPS